MPFCGFNVSAVSKLVMFLLDVAGHMTTRRGPDVARGPDVVHHCSINSELSIMMSVPVLGVLGRLQSVLTVKEIATSDTTQVSGIKIVLKAEFVCGSGMLNDGEV